MKVKVFILGIFLILGVVSISGCTSTAEELPEEAQNVAENVTDINLPSGSDEGDVSTDPFGLQPAKNIWGNLKKDAQSAMDGTMG